MRRAGSLFESVCSFRALTLAASRAARGKRDRPVVGRFVWNLEEEVLALERELREGSWSPGPARKFRIHDPKEREISVAPFRDRVVHHALCAQIGPVLERGAIHHSYACRVGKGTHAAVRHCQRLARRWRFFLKCDVRRYFPSVDHVILKRLLRRVLKDHRVLALLDRIIDAGGEDGRGLPIGNLTSQHLANFYLQGLDHFVLETLRPGAYLRYMDDILLFDDDRRRLRQMLGDIRRHLRSERSLELKEPATLLTLTAVGAPFLGLRIYPGAIRLRRRKVRRFAAMLRLRLWEAAVRSEGCDQSIQSSLGAIVAHVEVGSTPGFRRRVLEVL